MDEQLRKRVVGLVTLGIVAVLLSWLLPRPGLDSLSDESEQVISIDLVEPEPASQEDLIAMSSPSSMVSDTPNAATDEPGAVPPDDIASEKRDSTAATKPTPEAQADSGATSPSPEARAVETPPKPEPEGKPEPQTAVEPKPAPAKAEVARPEPASPKQDVAKSEPVAKPLEKADVGSSGFYVQAGAFSQLDSARAMQARCNLQGLDCKLLPTDSSQGTLYRVRCGPYGSRDVAEEAQSRLAGAGIKSSLVASGG